MDCNITLKDVTSHNTSLSKQPALFARVLAVVLLAFVTYTATANVTHSHGQRLNSQRTSAAEAINFNSPGGSSSSSKDLRAEGECLICQLHQHLFASLLQVLPGVESPIAQHAKTTEAVCSYLSPTDAPHSGRAPPLSSLL
ncbi:MAG: hypothetical protein JOZ52_13950 [Acidobacteria bacterium]|nr:hypothetical protein [Acidobacteriota bacterium]